MESLHRPALPWMSRRQQPPSNKQTPHLPVFREGSGRMSSYSCHSHRVTLMAPTWSSQTQKPCGEAGSGDTQRRSFDATAGGSGHPVGTAGRWPTSAQHCCFHGAYSTKGRQARVSEVGRVLLKVSSAAYLTAVPLEALPVDSVAASLQEDTRSQEGQRGRHGVGQCEVPPLA